MSVEGKAWVHVTRIEGVWVHVTRIGGAWVHVTRIVGGVGICY